MPGPAPGIRVLAYVQIAREIEAATLRHPRADGRAYRKTDIIH
jgi:hypothetical protein